MKILILSSSTGGGHDMRARSISQWCATSDSTSINIQTERYQGLEQTSPLYAFGVDLYNWIQKTWPTLHHLYFNFLEVFQVSSHDACLLGKQRYIETLRTYKPDAMVSVHAHLNHAFRKTIKNDLIHYARHQPLESHLSPSPQKNRRYFGTFRSTPPHSHPRAATKVSPLQPDT